MVTQRKKITMLTNILTEMGGGGKKPQQAKRGKIFQ